MLMSGGIGSPRLRDAPVSPVRVNMQADDWAQPSNADIEHARSRDGGGFVLADRTRDRDLPRTPLSPQQPQPPHGGSPTPRQPAQRAYNDAYDYQSTDYDRKPMSPGVASHGRIGSTPNSPTPSRLSGNGRFDYGSGHPRSHPQAPSHQAVHEDDNRHSRESDATTSTNRQHNSADSSAHTSTSSIGFNDTQDCLDDGSAGSSLIEGHMPRNQSVPLFQYHHQQHYPQRVSSVPVPGSSSHPDLNEAAAINRHLTPVSGFRRTSLPRPPSAYSAISDFGPRGRSPGLMPGGSHNRAPSVNSRKSPDPRPSSYAELLNVPYPQPAPAPISFDNTNLRNVVGNNASLLSAEKTLEITG